MRNSIPTDLVVVAVAAIATPTMALLLGSGGSSVQIVTGAVFILFAPGYALVSLLIPATHLVSLVDDDRRGPTEVSFFERTLLAVGLSVALVPLVGIVLYHSPLGLGPGPYLVVVGLGTLLLSVGAAVRRSRLQPNRRFSVGIAGLSNRLWALLGDAETNREAHLNVLFISGLLLAVVGVGTAITMSGNGEQFTEFYVQAEDPESGAITADEYPSDMAVGEEAEFIVGITNQEHQSSGYTVVVELQRLEGDEVVESSEIQRFKRTLDHNETVEEPIAVEPNIAGDDLRLSYQLYLDTPPEEPSADAAYRHVYIWVDVSPS